MVDVVSGFSALPTVFLRVGTDSPICFSEMCEHFTFCLSQLFFELLHVFYVSCSDVLCCLFLHVWRSSAARVRTFCTFCTSCFSKNVFFLKMSFHLVFLTNLMVLMVLMMLSMRRSSRSHAIRRFWLGSSGS